MSTIALSYQDTNLLSSTGDSSVKQFLEKLIFRKHRLTLTALGDAVGWHPDSLGKCLSGNRHVPAWLIPRLYRALGNDLDVFALFTAGTDVFVSRLPKAKPHSCSAIKMIMSMMDRLERLLELEHLKKQGPLTIDQDAEYERLSTENIQEHQENLRQHRESRKDKPNG